MKKNPTPFNVIVHGLNCKGVKAHDVMPYLIECYKETKKSKKAKEEVACTVEGSGITIGVKGSSLVDCLSAVDGDSVVIELDEVRKPINIYDPNCPNKALMVCPLVLNN